MGALSMLLVGVHGYRLVVVESASTVAFLFRDVGPLLVSLLVAIAIYWLTTRNLGSNAACWICAWFVAGMTTFGGIGFLIVFTQQSGGVALNLPYYLVVNSATAGVGIGLLVGLYDVRSKERDRILLGLHDATQNLIEARSKRDACQVSVDAAQVILQLSLTGIWLRNDTQLAPAAMSETALETFEHPPTFDSGESLAWNAFEKGTPELFEDIENHEDAHNPETPVEAEYIVPIGKHGVMISGTLSEGGFSSLQLELARVIAAHTELVLDRLERTERLRVREAELKQQNERLERFASVASHDLRNPINVMSGYLTLAEETGSEEHFDEIRTALDRMETLVDDLLALAESGKPIRETTPASLKSVVEGARNGVALEGIRVEIDPDLGVVEADESRLRQLFENLFRNVQDHASGADTIRVTAIDDGVAVEDNGPGIPPAERDRIFEYGYTSAQSGTGLGLSIVQEVVAGHGWNISVHESADGGARFEIRGIDDQWSKQDLEERFLESDRHTRHEDVGSHDRH
ncbi:sensor histidine kinase [Natrarchaeobius halalkaliphilus]|nr:GAF domain-containing sensor histidine kinase [Natrarchaeobius halalkaliphilus]